MQLHNAGSWIRHFQICVEAMKEVYLPILVSITPKPVVLSQSQKYKAAFTEAQKLANLVSEMSMEKYKDVLRKLVSLWEVD